MNSLAQDVNSDAQKGTMVMNVKVPNARPQALNLLTDEDSVEVNSFETRFGEKY